MKAANEGGTSVSVSGRICFTVFMGKYQGLPPHCTH